MLSSQIDASRVWANKYVFPKFCHFSFDYKFMRNLPSTEESCFCNFESFCVQISLDCSRSEWIERKCLFTKDESEYTSLQAVHSIRTFCLCSTETVDDDNTEKDFGQNMNIQQKRIKLALTRDGDAIERQAVCSFASCLVNSFAK